MPLENKAPFKTSSFRDQDAHTAKDRDTCALQAAQPIFVCNHRTKHIIQIEKNISPGIEENLQKVSTEEIRKIYLEEAAFRAPSLAIILAACHMGFGATRPPC